jgi:hypothetical protein
VLERATSDVARILEDKVLHAVVDTSCITYPYVGAGLTTRTWTVAMPTTPGTYEFRLFLNNGYARAATSPTVTVGTSSAPAP